MADSGKIRFFKSAAMFRKWLEANHEVETELWVAYYKRDSGKESITWPQSVDQALCFGWIDGLRKNIDEVSYKIRFSPRKAKSVWSKININRVNELTEAGLMRPKGVAAFEARLENKSGIYSYEQRSAEMPEPYVGIFRKNAAAFEFYSSQTAAYRKMMNWWILSAKREETRLKRLEILIERSAQGINMMQEYRASSRAAAKK